MSATPAPNPDAVALTDDDIRAVRRRSMVVLITGQVLAGIGMGATLSAGALLITEVSGSETLSGMAATMTTIGAAVAAVPLAALATRRGRAPSLATGAFLAALGAAVGLGAAIAVSTPLLLAGLSLIGIGTAVNLQARFAATDLSEPGHRARDLAMIVWPTTIGAVLGPNLIQPADDLGLSLGLPSLSGPFLFTFAAQVLAAFIYLVGLRPDPLRVARQLGAQRPAAAQAATRIDQSGVATGMISLSLSHATMVAVMAMTPVHLVHHGASLALVGFTISLHVLGMYVLSPVWGSLADRFGREAIIGCGQVLLLAALVIVALGAESATWVTVGLALIGLGWSASTVAGSALISDSVGVESRARIQGRSDLLMSSAGAIGGAASGLILSVLGFGGLALAATALVAIVLVALVARVWRGRGSGEA